MTNSQSFKDHFLQKLSEFSEEDRQIFDRIYKVWETRGELNPPVEMTSWIESSFGSVDAVKVQDFLKITNIITYEGAIFNELRTRRPVVGDDKFQEVIEQIESAKDGPFSHPETGTPEDIFGRVKGKYCITAANIAKYDGLHGLIIFNDHDPLLFSRDRVRDYFDVATKWFAKAQETNEKAIYPFYTWNCLWRAGASIIHGHSQLALTEGNAYAKVEELRVLTHEYQERNRTNYFEDVYKIHNNLGLAFQRGDIKLIAKITPIKEKELMIVNHGLNDNLADVVSDTLTTLKEKLAVSSFNLSIILPPLSETPEVWDHMPIIVRIVDRGKLSAKTADVGAMELYAQSIIETNPYIVIKELKSAFGVE